VYAHVYARVHFNKCTCVHVNTYMAAIKQITPNNTRVYMSLYACTDVDVFAYTYTCKHEMLWHVFLNIRT